MTPRIRFPGGWLDTSAFPRAHPGGITPTTLTYWRVMPVQERRLSTWIDLEKYR